jgi:molybdopterin-containing oxidoreductase family iron-sulfur binding subunit
MGLDRRKFLRVSGLTALGLASGAGIKAWAQDDSTMVEPMAPKKPDVENPLEAHRWAMVIDMKKCKQADGCDACQKACHVFHNVPTFDNPKDEIKWIWKEEFSHAFHEQKHEFITEELKHLPVPLLCNHCDNPPCVRVCPTQATWKRESDGIVMMDWHRCIGCRYCVVACPYGSRSFNWRDPRPHIAEINPDYPTRSRGVVEKCTFCEERLAKGLMPSCVEACPEKALVFGDLEDPESEVRKLLGEHFALRRKPELGTKPEVYYIV